MKHQVAPSLLAANFLRLEEEVRMINKSDADYLHLDIMDGHFVPNLSYGFPIIRDVASISKKPLDVHLMIEKPERFIERFRTLGAEIITVHYEACPHLHRTISEIRESGAKAGVALNPHTPVTLLEHLLEDLDLILIMSVNPGFGGQKLIYQTIPKIRKLVGMLTTHNSHAVIEVDGGVGLQNAEALLKAGARILVAGSAIFKAGDPLDVIRRMKAIGAHTNVA